MSLPAEDNEPVQRAPWPAVALGLRIMSMVVVVTALGFLVLVLIPANEYAELPGQALPVAPMISVQGHDHGHIPANLLMTDVTLVKVDHLLEHLYFTLNSDARLEPAGQVSGNLNQSQFQQESLAEMHDSIQQAEVAALNATPGYHVRCCEPGPQVLYTFPGLPAARYLRPGDIFSAIDGHAVRTASQVGRYIKQLRPGQRAHIAIVRGRRRIQVAVPTVPSTNGQPDKRGHVAIIGVLTEDRLVFPVKISIKSGNIGGPSAGLMFALGIIQRLEHHDLTHGCTVAGTGSIDATGKVGAIGGAKQKVIAARGAGARYFLVPDVAENVKPTVSARGDVTVVPVKTLAQALTYLKRIKPCSSSK